jgi:nucleoside-diphosphate-sugar epimerase
MGSNIVVTGGASFIGSHLVEKLLERGDTVRVLDNFSSGSEENLSHLPLSSLTISTYELLGRFTPRLFEGVDIVYHLAADHGGRGYVETQQAACSANFEIDQKIFRFCQQAGVPKVIFASSGCIYPMNLQFDLDEIRYLKEEDAGPPYDPDGLYGWAKMAGELTLKRMCEESDGKMKGASCRFFTVYGPRGKENHAVIAFIARSFIGQDPFEIWGDGTAVRNWTYVDDIVDGMIASESLADKHGYDAINLGTMERTSVVEAVEYVNSLAGYKPEFKFLKDMPVGPLNRIANNTRMVSELGLAPVPFREGVKRTWEWYSQTKDRDAVAADLDRLLIARK